jgi:uncharacterized membrane protein HdeD (DUF308 family)
MERLRQSIRPEDTGRSCRSFDLIKGLFIRLVLHPDHQTCVDDGVRRGFRLTGIVFAALGALAIIAPTMATPVAEQPFAWLLVLCAIAGVIFAAGFRAFSEWRLLAAGFVAVLLTGIACVLLAAAGAAVVTGVLISVFLLEGVLSILLGLRPSGHVDDWRWIIFNGVCSFGPA